MWTRVVTISLPLALMLASPTSLAAQATVDLRFGVTRGTVAAGSLNELGQVPRTGFTAGMAVTVPMAARFGLRVGLTYTGRGTTYGMNRDQLPHFGDEPEPVQGTLTYRGDYIEVSALARAMLLGGGRASLYAVAGPALAFSRKCNVDFRAPIGPNASWGSSWGRCDLPVGPDSLIQLEEGADFGALAGIGGDVELWDVRFSLEALYYFGLTSDNHGGGEAVRHRVRTAQFGLSLPFG